MSCEVLWVKPHSPTPSDDEVSYSLTHTNTHTDIEKCGRQEGETVPKMRGELLGYFLHLRRSIKPKTMSQPITFITVTWLLSVGHLILVLFTKPSWQATIWRTPLVQTHPFPSPLFSLNYFIPLLSSLLIFPFISPHHVYASSLISVSIECQRHVQRCFSLPINNSHSLNHQ